jgi:hypothetical protein
MFARFICLNFLLAANYFSTAQSAVDEKEIRSVLKAQTINWNRGDIDSFMSGYWQNDSLLFIGQSGVTFGYEQTKANYKRNYSDTAKMGKLSFEILQVKPLSASNYFVLGKWHLQRTIGNVSGYYSLIFQKINNRWQIISDHSSTEN